MCVECVMSAHDRATRIEPSRFPDAELAGPDGIIAVGGDLSVSTLLDAYRNGIFPWPQEGLPLLWFSPAERGIIDLRKAPIAPKKFLKDLRRDLQRGALQFTLDQDFERVIRFCSAVPRPGQEGTWLLPEMVEAYTGLHRAGYAHSFEVKEDGELVGGLYGVFVDGVFSGESMFHLRSNRSKAALWLAIQFLRVKGVGLFDVQMVTEVVRQFGGELVLRGRYLERLRSEQQSFLEREKGEFLWESSALKWSVLSG